MKLLAVVLAALVAIPASANDESNTQVVMEAAELAVMAEKNAKACNWYDHWYNSQSLSVESSCGYNDYWTAPQFEYSPQWLLEAH